MKQTNFHTHTSRCHHAFGNDEEFVRTAILRFVMDKKQNTFLNIWIGYWISVLKMKLII